MNITTLQGINLKNPYTTVIVEMDATPKTDLIDLLRGFHDIFMYDYSVEGNVLSIQTKLPQLWKEASKTLNSYATGQITYDEAKDSLLNKIIRGQVYSMSTIPILVAARDMGLELNQFFMDGEIDLYTTGSPSQWNRYYRVGMGRHSGVTVSSGSSGDSILALKSSRDKRISNLVVTQLKMPIAPWDVIESEAHLRELFETFTKPVVIKPTGLTQGSGVTTNINDIDHAIHAYNYAKDIIGKKNRAIWQTNVMIQQQVYGDDYRLLVVNGKLEIATKRIPAFIVGDGKSSIRSLIEDINKDPRRNIENPAHILKPINFDVPLQEFLEEQGLSLEHIPNDQERIYVRKVASMSQGGITEDFTDKVHPQIRSIAESIASSIHANVVGIDVICRDISKTLTIENGSFIEFNTMPESYLNSFPVLGKQYPDIGSKIVSGLIQNKPYCKGIVMIGQVEDVYQILLEKGLVEPNSRTGIYHRNSLYMNGDKLNDAMDHHVAVRALKINASLDNIVIVHDNIESVEMYGTGFDRIDILVTDIPELFEDRIHDGLISQKIALA
ncbi:hypothetical protein H6763_03275 [Candidatus Nomurabacteria bacterium]|uniref:ATP-grasp domain-containing protein n=1 Tax=Candidatus Dojkabacteria bacterium TaxID=2099670 RepID=A0A955I1E2_9BACT|nr:hypothetical protein [Candidatus Dojkabacteria bacterium]MCB9789731.1 hypothetical protein [Candidatus Nomurabacteria bacterium]MCB9803828.1 hypothetical protein [Candidatus Nomurabacteria bacterium]